MPFNSITFIFYFFPLCLLLYYLVQSIRLKNISLIIFSFVFYFWGEGRGVAFFFCFIVFGWIFGIILHRHHQKFLLFLAVTIPLSCLFYFKYLHFFLPSATKTNLPLGISFFTFQLISYLIDCYRQKITQPASLFNFAFYLSFFPYLISGPITRYPDIQKFISSRKLSIASFQEGIIRFSFGLTKKILLAGNLSVISDQIFLQPADKLPAIISWLGVFTYSLQIFLDFSGYSDMAIGLAKMFAIDLPENFHYPYFSSSITDFWRRWHISLSSWFRDYLYIPLGGNRCPPLRNYFNLLIVFSLCGLWHGAAYTFFVWGVYHGILLVIDKIVTQFHFKLPTILHIITTFTLVSLGWVLFKVNSLRHAITFYQSLIGHKSSLITFSQVFSPRQYLSASSLITFFILSIIFTFIPIKVVNRQPQFLCQIFAVIFLLISLVYLSENTYKPFIYFRF